MNVGPKRCLGIALLIALALMLALPASGMAARVKTAAKSGINPLVAVPPDAYENDDTTTTAKVLPPVSFHTFSNTTTSADQDWGKFYADATGTPFVVETQTWRGWYDGFLAIYSVDPSTGVPTSIVGNDDTGVWDYSYGSTLYFSAPAPGWYYVLSNPLGGDTGEVCQYLTFVEKGIGRRFGGADRFQTAAMASRTMWPETNNAEYGTGDSPNGVIIANGSNWPDALTGAALGAMGQGGQNDMPVLLVGRDSVPAATRAEFARLSASDNWDQTRMKIYVLGGKSVISDRTVWDLANSGPEPYTADDIVRLGGTSRFGTAAQVASAAVGLFGDPDTVFIATGADFADGLTASALCGADRAPLLYSHLATVGPATSEWILQHPSVTSAVIVGGPSVVSEDVLDALAAPPYSLDVTRVAGANRFSTARKLAEFGIANYGMDPNMLLVNGFRFPDGLAAGPLTGNTGGVIMLTPGNSLSPEVKTFFDDHAADLLPAANGTSINPNFAIGGDVALSPAIVRAWQDLYKTAP